MGTTQHVNDVMPDFHRATLKESDHQLYYKRTNTNISPMEHSDKHIIFMDVFRMERGGRRERRQEGKGIIYKEK